MRRTLGYLCFAGFVAMGAATEGQSLEELGEAFGEEVRQLEVDLREHAKARDLERDAVIELQQANRELDSKLEDPSSSLANLRRLEARLESLRLEFAELAQRGAEARAAMYLRMERVDRLLGEIEAAGVDIVHPGEGLTGTWRLDVPEYGVTGVTSLRQEGSLIRGSYHMSTGASGSLQGTFAGGKLKVESVSAEDGAVGPSTGELDSESGEIRGVWLARDLSSGGPSRVDWTARLLTLDDLLDAP